MVAQNGFLSGSSPQARGTRRGPGRSFRRPRFIPAGAGNAARACRGYAQASVHPRRRGERADVRQTHGLAGGSSPQARGTPHRRAPDGHRPRFIPAGAGNANRPSNSEIPSPVHPRRRGERLSIKRNDRDRPGSSPQARGTQNRYDPIEEIIRFIPAGAGNASRPSFPQGGRSVHPRRRGERRMVTLDLMETVGSSPQARGTRLARKARRSNSRFIPAGAGNACRGDDHGL